jgi:pyruvate dehydrogenase E2 component (dihydrolipoamide acetyltransferase)
MADVVMPRLSDTMEEGTILRWLKADGETVARGEELVEIETDKATMIYESDQAGTLLILAPEGSTLAVGEVIARVGEQAGKTDEGPAPAGPAGGSTAASSPAGDGGAEPLSATPGSQPTVSAGSAERVKASPLARRIAREGGIDLGAIAGSGPGGRIVKADVLGASARTLGASADAPNGAADTTAAGAAPPAAEVSPGAGGAAVAPVASVEGVATSVEAPASVEGVATAKGQSTEVELTRTQQTIARRMAESKATIPDFTLQMDVDMHACVSLRAELKGLAHRAAAGEHGGTGEREAVRTPTYNDMVVKACALALREYPYANGSYRDGRVQLHSRVNVGVAVAAQDALVVPTVFDADEKSLGEIARETHALAARVREETITPPELGGGTFTVSNLGMYGVRSFTAIVNPPQAAILSVGSVEPRAVVSGEELIARHTMTLTLVCDHRILYGAQAAEFLARVRELLQTPSALTL